MEVYQRMVLKHKTNPMGDTCIASANITIKKQVESNGNDEPKYAYAELQMPN
jgi:hypothetical protein